VTGAEFNVLTEADMQSTILPYGMQRRVCLQSDMNDATTTVVRTGGLAVAEVRVHLDATVIRTAAAVRAVVCLAATLAPIRFAGLVATGACSVVRHVVQA
jgi:hypothetical protein